MEIIIDKCTKCFNDCKCKTETNARIVYCPKYSAKRNRDDLRASKSERGIQV